MSRFKLKDIPLVEVLLEVDKRSRLMHSGRTEGYIAVPFVYEGELAKKWPPKLIYKKMDKAAEQGYIEYGVSLRTGWLTDKGVKVLLAHGHVWEPYL